MAKRKPKGRGYPPEFREQIVGLHRAGRSAKSLAKEFDLAYQTVLNWLKQEDLNTGKRTDGLTSSEREELTRLRRENRRLKEEREILSKAAAWFATESGPSKRSSGS